MSLLPRLRSGELPRLETSLQVSERFAGYFDPENFMKTNGGGGSILLIPIPADHPRLRVRQKGSRCGIVLAHKDGNLRRGDIVWHRSSNPAEIDVEGNTVIMVYNHNAEVAMVSRKNEIKEGGNGREVIIPISQISSFAGEVKNAFRR